MFKASTLARHLIHGLIMGALSLPALATTSTPVVDTGSGQLSGVRDGELNVFKGIPYAAPPVGPLRWKPPQPVSPWQGVRTADHFGPRCMQRPVFNDMVFRSDGMSEDCLYLNVWTPADNAGKKLPVLVYFYGGGFIAGDASEPRYDGASMAQHGVVTVTVNYRLDVLGFLATSALAAESPQHAAGNYGLLDQQAALQWVRSHIARFGGDPDRVTIGGESAGSMSVSAQLASPLSKGLMRGAIGESGAMLGNLKPIPLSEAIQRGEQFAHLAKAGSLEHLRAMSAQALLEVSGRKDAPELRPTVDGYFFPRSPEAIYAAGEQARVPLLVGTNSQEGSYANLLENQPPTPANYRAAVEKLFGTHATEALRLYPGRSEEEVRRSGTALAGDRFIAWSTWRWMELQRRTGTPVYFYYFTQPRPARRDGSGTPDEGSVHSGEIEYALGNLPGNSVFAWTDADRKVSALTQAYWVNFIKTGNPNGPGLPAWPAVAEKDGGLLRQRIGGQTATEVDPGAARYRFLLANDPDGGH